MKNYTLYILGNLPSTHTEYPVLLVPPPQARPERVQTSPIARFEAYFNTN